MRRWRRPAAGLHEKVGVQPRRLDEVLAEVRELQDAQRDIAAERGDAHARALDRAVQRRRQLPRELLRRRRDGGGGARRGELRQLFDGRVRGLDAVHEHRDDGHRVDGRVLRVEPAAAVLEDDDGERLVEPLVAARATQADLRALLLGLRRARLEGDAEECRLDELERLGVGRVAEQRGARLRPLVARQRGEHRDGRVVGELEQRPLGECEAVEQLGLQLLQVERRAGRGVDRHRHHRALAHDHDMPRVGNLRELVLPLLRHPRHPKDAQELVHVEHVAAHLLDREGAGIERRAELDEPLADDRRGLHVG